MIEQLKQIRIDLDEVNTLVGKTTPSTHLIRTCESLLLGRAWIGTLLGEIGDPTPYKNDGKRTTVADIEPTDGKQVFTSGIEHSGKWDLMSHVAKIDWLRERISFYCERIRFLERDFATTELGLKTREQNIARTQAWVHLKEARFHLGWELERVREEA